MPTKPAIPRHQDVVGPAVDAMRSRISIDEAHISFGRWGHIVAGWRGQFELGRKRLVEEFNARRLKTASGIPLTELASSDYEVEREGERAAIGEATLERLVTHYASSGTTITAVDAVDFDTAEDLADAIIAACTAHFASVYNPSTGVGAHAVADTTTPVTSSTYSSWTLFLNAAIFAMQAVDWHIRNFTGLGPPPFTQGALHHPDPATHAEIPEPFFGLKTDNEGNPLSDVPNNSTDGSRLSVFRCLNAAKSAFNVHVVDTAPGGVIRRGHRFEVRADPTARPPIEGAQYTAELDTFVPIGDQEVSVRVVASSNGTRANQPNWVVRPDKTVVSQDTIYDFAQPRHFAPTELLASGGHSGQSDGALKRAASANWTGRNGPTLGAIIAGTLTDQGATRAVVREDATTGSVLVYPVDESWAQSVEWKKTIAEALSNEHDGWLGFGCRLSTELVQNRAIKLELTVRLRDARYLLDTTGITAKIQAAMRNYFDERPDWYVWRLATIKAVVSRADRRILACQAAAVIDASTGVPMSDPAIPAASSGVTLVHYALNDQDLLISYTAQV